jgi:hypothetical protein
MACRLIVGGSFTENPVLLETIERFSENFLKWNTFTAQCLRPFLSMDTVALARVNNPHSFLKSNSEMSILNVHLSPDSRLNAPFRPGITDSDRECGQKANCRQLLDRSHS